MAFHFYFFAVQARSLNLEYLTPCLLSLNLNACTSLPYLSALYLNSPKHLLNFCLGYKVRSVRLRSEI